MRFVRARACAECFVTACVIEQGGDSSGQALGIDCARLGKRIGSRIVDIVRQALEAATELDVALDRQRRLDRPTADAGCDGFG